METNADYMIAVDGLLDAHWARWFEGFSITAQPDGKTHIIGSMIDQAALFGILTRIRDLGLVLVSVQRLGKEETLPLKDE